MSYNEIEETLIIEIVKITFDAIKKIKKSGVEPETLNALRENIRFLVNYFNGQRKY